MKWSGQVGPVEAEVWDATERVTGPRPSPSPPPSRPPRPRRLEYPFVLGEYATVCTARVLASAPGQGRTSDGLAGRCRRPSPRPPSRYNLREPCPLPFVPILGQSSLGWRLPDRFACRTCPLAPPALGPSPTPTSRLSPQRGGVATLARWPLALESAAAAPYPTRSVEAVYR